MSFLYPVLLLTGLAAALPVLLHLIRRRELRRLTFPAIRYLRLAEQRYARRLRLRHLALLAARVVLILLLAVAAAGPLVGRGSATDHRPTAIALVVDWSLSSARLIGEQTLLDSFVARALTTLDLATIDDRVALFSAVDPGEAAVALSSPAVGEYLNELRPAGALADLPSALQEAAAWLKSQEPLAGEIHLLTDLQAVSIPVPPPGASGLIRAGRGLSVIGYAPIVPEGANGAPAVPVPDELPLTVGRQTTISVPLHFFGPEVPPDPVVVRLVIGDDVVAVGEGRFGEAALLLLPSLRYGWAQGHAEIDLHGLAVDDRRYFSWPTRPAVAVAINGDPGPFVTDAVTTLQEAGRLSLAAAADADVWLVAGGTGLEEALAGGKSVIVVPPADPLDLPRLNSGLERARVPWRYRPAQPAAGATRLAPAESLPDLQDAVVRSLYQLSSVAAADLDGVLLSTTSGEPWLIRDATPAGVPYLLLASPLLPEAIDLPVTAAMLPFVDALVGDWARRGSAVEGTFEGPAEMRLPPRARSIALPDGTVLAVEGGAPFRAAQPGHYRVTDGDSLILAFSLNAPLRESDLSRGRPEDLQAALPGADWHWVFDPGLGEWRKTVYRDRRGWLAWRPLVVLLLAVSIVEAVIAAAGRRREAAAGSADRR